MAKRSKLELEFKFLLKTAGDGLPMPTEEYRFHPVRRWRFDFAYVDRRLAIEIDGGQWKPRGGRHASDGDREKLNAAAVLGWRVLRYSGAMLKNPEKVMNQVKQAYEWEPNV